MLVASCKPITAGIGLSQSFAGEKPKDTVLRREFNNSVRFKGKSKKEKTIESCKKFLTKYRGELNDIYQEIAVRSKIIGLLRYLLRMKI